MKKTAPKILDKKDTANTSSMLYLSFCRALEKYCDQVGVNSRHFSAGRILHEAAGNTVSQMHSVTRVQQRYMAQMERNIPKMFEGLVEISNKDGYLRTVERMSTMSLAQVSNIITKNSRKR